MTYYSGIFSSYALGAPSTTEGKFLPDQNIDKIDRGIGSLIRRQNRYLNLNGTDIPSIVASSTARTIGVSINVQVESNDKAFNSAAEELIEEHNAKGVGELTNKHHFNSAMRAISDFDLLDGGIIIRHHYNPAWAIPYKYELVSVDMIDTSKQSYSTDTTGERTVAGIVMNVWGQPTHIWLYDNEHKRSSTMVSIGDLTYYSDVWASVSQQAAISRLASILPTLDYIDQYGKAELAGAIESAKAGAYLKSDAFNEIMLILRDQLKTNASFQTNIRDTGLYDMMLSVAQGKIKQSGLTPIPSADDVIYNPIKREGIYDSLNKSAENKMASSLGMSAISTYGKAEDANYSGIKFSAEMDQLSANIRWDNISNKIVRDIHIRLIQVGVQIGRIPNRVSYWKNPNKFHRFSYLRNVHVDIEPGKTASANQINIEIGVMSPKEIVEKRTGRKYEDFLREKINAEILEETMRTEMRTAAGLNPNQQPTQPQEPQQ